MSDPEEPAQKTGYRKAAIRGAGWITLGRVFRTVSTILTLSILSRFLPPEAFGIAGLIIFIQGFAQIFGDMGTRVAIIRKENEVTDIELQSAFWFNTIMGTVVTCAVFLLAPTISEAVGDPALVEPLKWATPLFFLFSMQSIPAALLERRLAFATIAITESISTLVGAIVAIGMVLVGFGIEALIGQMLAISIVSVFAVLWAAHWTPRVQFSLVALKPLLSIGIWTSLAGAVAYAGTNLERPVLVGALSTAALGYFTLAQQIIANPLRTIVQVIRKLTLPIFSRIQNETDRASRAYVDTIHATVAGLSGVCFCIAAVADPLVNVLFGPGWDPVIPILVLLSLRAVLNSVNDVNGGILTAKGWVRFQFYWSFASMVLSLVILMWSVQWGLVAAVASRVALTVVLTPIYSSITLRAMQVSWRDFLNAILRPMLAGTIMAVSVYYLLQALPLGKLLELIIGLSLGTPLYLGLLLIVDRQRITFLYRSLLNRKT